MKIPDTKAAFRRYDLQRDPVDHSMVPVLPENPDFVHAVDMEKTGHYRPRSLRQLDSMRDPIFAEYSFQYVALCDRSVRVILPLPFDTEGEDVCPQCARWLDLRAVNPADYQRQRHEWLQDKYAREDEWRNVEDWKYFHGDGA
ncbi:hypothetical protein EF294_07440 [Gordonia oryzae]|uniref:Uncharacterized protein n=1 Tax=Gordonia oryzae TaxID=2487349 RepID=A0A3N4GVH9_9ACTN|nr:hypothetical protein [Gordonia oryzae]RPA64908.1 hypothetical protein EF294_07440 [Gordonia oryzae]